jgi:hypothetical protein
MYPEPSQLDAGKSKREIKVIIAVTAVLACVVLIGFLWNAFSPDAGRMDMLIAAKIHGLCDMRADCKVRIGDMLEGDWDTFYEFGSEVSQDTINQTLNTRRIRTHRRERIYALVKEGKVIASSHGPYGVDTPDKGEVEFEEEHHREQHIVRYDHDTLLRITTYQHPPNGEFYVLTSKLP